MEIILSGSLFSCYNTSLFSFEFAMKDMPEEGKNPSVQIALQYLKDLSIENPTPFELLGAAEGEVKTQMAVDVQATPFEDQVFEVVIFLKVEVLKEEKKSFLMEMHYAGIFHITEAKEDILPLLLFVQCPHLLFPTVRHMVRSLTQESGLPGFNLENINFLDLFKKKLEDSKTKIIT